MRPVMGREAAGEAPGFVRFGEISMLEKPIARRNFLASLAGTIVIPALSKGANRTITLESLLREMIDRDRLVRFPDPAYVSGQASSYDRAKVAPGDPSWFANRDVSQFIRFEENDGRTESVMMDAEGPGTITRFWMGAPVPDSGPKGTIRVYLDGSHSPVIEQEADLLLSGRGLVGPPLSAITSIGRNLYLPIPYSSRCKVTYDRPDYWKSNHPEDRAWYVIEYRTYAKDTRVESFKPESLSDAARVVMDVQKALAASEAKMPADSRVIQSVTGNLAPGGSLERNLIGPGAVLRLSVQVEADDMAQALRSCALSIDFDGEHTVWCPAGDFFGSGAGLNPYRDWFRQVEKSGRMVCYWVMPFRRRCKIRLLNLGGQEVRATLGPNTIGNWTWDERSMLFHANWRHQYPLETIKEGGLDWNYIKIRGQGVYVGDTLAIHNGSSRWWGEGDEKIFVDGERFPSHIGTGTEDYYGYSFGDKGVFFEAPFHAQPRAEGNNRPGHTTNTRTRSLDAIPFQKSLDFDMEVWHWAQTTMAFAAATYWYARPGAESNRGPEPVEARKAILK